MQHDLKLNIQIYAYNGLIISTSHDINPINNINNTINPLLHNVEKWPNIL